MKSGINWDTHELIEFDEEHATCIGSERISTLAPENCGQVSIWKVEDKHILFWTPLCQGSCDRAMYIDTESVNWLMPNGQIITERVCI